MSSSFVYCFFLFFSLFISGHFSIPVTISNAKNRVSVDGKILDAHDSKFYYHAVDGLFYWFAASYGDCIEPSGQDGCAGWHMGSCGFRFDHNVTLFVSHNLVDWVNRGVVFQAALNLPSGVTFFAPKTIYNNKTKEWVMWYNYMENGFQNSYYGVAASKNAEGPFRTVVPKVNSLKYQDDGDLNLFVDDDGQGYIIYTSIENNHGMSIERLTDDYYLSLGANASSGFFGAVWCEAPMLWKRNGLYYAAFGPVCCYCGSGQIVTAYVAPSIFGPYTVAGSLGQLHSQSTDIFIYPDDNGEWQAMYVGDHWQSAPDHVKGHDKTVWAPLFFSEDGKTVKTNGYQDEFTIDLKVKTNDMIAMK